LALPLDDFPFSVIAVYTRGANALRLNREREGVMSETNIAIRTRARDAWLRARWTPDLVRRFEKAAEAEGRKAPEVLRELAAGFLRTEGQHKNA
jgi:hypothetical protein